MHRLSGGALALKLGHNFDYGGGHNWVGGVGEEM